jgi:hypothetical protein
MSENVDKIDFLQFLPNEPYNLDFKTTKKLTINGQKFNRSVLTEENKENKESGHIVYCDNGEINYILFTTGESNFVFHFETGVSLNNSKEYSFAFSKDNDKTFLINSIDLNTVIEINEQYFFEYNDYYYYIVAGNCLSSNENKEYYNNRGEGACLFDAFAQIFFPIDYDNVKNKADININHYNKVKETSKELRKIVARIHTEALSNYNSYHYALKDNPDTPYYKNIFDNINNYFSIKSNIKGSEGEKYIRNIEFDSVWGEDYEIQILSKYFNLNCNLIQDNKNFAQMNINILKKEIDKNNNPDNLKELTEHLQKANKELENAKKSGLKFFNQSKNDNYDKMYPFLDKDNNTYAYPYIFCNIGNNHWELKKHYCKLDFKKESTEAKKRFEDLKKGIYEDNKKKPSNDETQEIANIIKAIDVFINSGSSSSKPVDYSDEVVGVVGAVDGSSSGSSSSKPVDYNDEVVDVVDAIDGSSSSTSTTNDYNDEVVDVLGALEQSSSSSSITGTTTASSSSSSVTSTTFIVSEEKTNLINYFMKTSYIIKKGNKNYLFAEIINTPPVPTLLTNRPLGPYKEIYKNDEITITEFWQNKLIDTNQIGYIIEDGAEKYGVVPDF